MDVIPLFIPVVSVSHIISAMVFSVFRSFAVSVDSGWADGLQFKKEHNNTFQPGSKSLDTSCTWLRADFELDSSSA